LRIKKSSASDPTAVRPEEKCSVERTKIRTIHNRTPNQRIGTIKPCPGHYDQKFHSITVIDKLMKKNERGEPFRLMDHQREILRLAFDFDRDGRLPWDTILSSCAKKSGKTTINAALTLAWALTQEAPNEILILANDREQPNAYTLTSCKGTRSSFLSSSW
jgi:phage terminase large subunit-like protein